MAIHCKYCKSTVQENSIVRSKSGKDKFSFCSDECHDIYMLRNNKNVTEVNRSNGELYFENLIKKTFPELEVQSNVKGLIPSGLDVDIYLPAIRLCIEINGPSHYLDIFGEDKLLATQVNDAKKKQELYENGYSLIVINISRYKALRDIRIYLKRIFLQEIRGIIELLLNKISDNE